MWAELHTPDKMPAVGRETVERAGVAAQAVRWKEKDDVRRFDVCLL